MRTFTYIQLSNVAPTVSSTAEYRYMLRPPLFANADDLSVFKSNREDSFWAYSIEDNFLLTGGNSIASLGEMTVYRDNFTNDRFLFEIQDGICISETYASGPLISSLFRENHVCKVATTDVDFSQWITRYTERNGTELRFVKSNLLLHDKPSVTINIPKNTLYFDSLFQYNYWHTIIDGIDKCSGYLLTGANCNVENILYSPKFQYQLDFLKILFPCAKVLQTPPGNFSLANHFLLPLQSHRLNPPAFDAFRRMIGVPETPCSLGRRIYISRNRPESTRAVADEEALTQLLSRFGIERVLCENLSLHEQIKLFRSAEAIVGPHGAGFANMMFAPKGCKIIELVGIDYPSPSNWILANTLEHRYYRIICGLENSKYIVDFKLLEMLLSRLF
jgi:hypothetical protein